MSRTLPAPPNPANLVDLYELTMLQAYWLESMHGQALFSLHFRELPPERNYMLTCGLAPTLQALKSLQFERETLDWMAREGGFREDFLRWLEKLRFTGTVRAMPEGSVVFPHEPLLEIEAPISEAQLVESTVMNQMHLHTVLATSAARMASAAGERPVADFALRRMHGSDAAIGGARAFYIGGIAATSNVEAGRLFDIPVTGTMAHSYVQAHRDEDAALRAFARAWPGTTLLVDTRDTLAGVRKVIRMAEEQGEAFDVNAIRIDSGDLGALARQARQLLNEAGLEQVRILVSGGLDEYRIRDLLAQQAPIDGFGVGTRLGTGGKAPALDLAYKLVSYNGRDCIKTSPGKTLYPGAKQVFRQHHNGRAQGDILAGREENHPGQPLLTEVMRDGEITEYAGESLQTMRERASEQIRALPEPLQAPEVSSEAWPVTPSEALEQRRLRLSH